MSSSIVKSVAQQLGTLMVEEAKYLYNVRDKIESLQMELAWMECFLRDADNQQHQEKIVCMWVSHVRDLAYDAEDIIERYLHGVRHHRRDGVRNTLKWFSGVVCSSDARTLHNLGLEVDSLTVKMSELTKRLRRYGIQIIKTTRSIEGNSVIREERRTYSHTEEDVVGMEKDIQQVVDLLLEKTVVVKVVAISGTGGLGKTTLARKVFKHKDIKDHFNDNCAWVYISREFDEKTIFQEILLGLEKSEEARKRIKEQLKQEEFPGEISKLLQGKKCLVVVDDIWTVTAWERLKPAFESVFTIGSSSKILFTTRKQGLLQHVDRSGYLHLLQPLSDDGSWELLKRKAFIGHESAGGESSTTPGHHKFIQNEPQDAAKVKYERDQMEELGKKMLKHCNGLPIAIVALRGILFTKYTILEWEVVGKNILSYLMGGIDQEGEDGNPILMKVIELSYLDLPFYLKPCFLYLGNFPEDHQISTQRLYHLWEAEGLLTTEGEAKIKRETSYDIGIRYLNELVQRSMVQVGECWTSGKNKTCQVHDVMRDMCLRKCEEVNFLSHREGTEIDMTSTLTNVPNNIKKLHRCALNNQKGDFVDEHFQHVVGATGLRSLLVFQTRKISQKVWKSFGLLRILDLEGIQQDSIGGVEHLIHLRYLSLRESVVYKGMPSGLFDLKYLETLDLRHKKFSKMLTWELSNKYFKKMKRLKHLYLPWEFKIKRGKKLTFPTDDQMETIKNFDPERCETKELLQMTNLKVFSITSWYTFVKAEELKWVLEAPVIKKAGQLINSLGLKITGDVIKEDPAILSSAARHPCFNKLNIWGPLRLEDRSRGNATLNSSTLFPDRLIRLEIRNCEIGEADLLALEKLLHLKSLDLAGDIILGAEGGNKLSFSPGSFPQLTNLELKWRPEWEEWEVGDGALPHLQRLSLNGCSKLKKVKNMPNSLTQVGLNDCEIGGEGGDLLLLEFTRRDRRRGVHRSRCWFLIA